MTSATTRVGPRFRIVIPKRIRDAAGIKEGDFIEAEVRPAGILLRSKALVDRDLESGLAEALDDLEAGRFHGAYEDAVKGLDEAVKRERERGLGNRGIQRGPRIKRRKSR
jgi:AbrB family looped-hinge helix DNA binding protein